MPSTGWYFVALFLVFSPIHLSSAKDVIDGGLVNKDVERKIDVSASLARITTTVTVENTGKSVVGSYLIAVEADGVDSLAYIGVTTKDGKTTYDVQKASVDGVPVGVVMHKVTFSKPLSAGATVTMVVTTVYTHVLTPFPAEIRQAEKQLVKYTGNVYFYSPYQTVSQKTIVSLSSTQVESYTKTPKPVTKSDNTITYGPYEKTDPFSSDAIIVHYENNRPFLAVTKMTRVIEISHWGNIAVEETYDVRHTGAKLKGPFSRYDYQRQPDPLSSIKSYKTVLPASAADVYYRDEIGNISTSNMKLLDDAVELELRPRFPLFGGWKTHYIIGYNIPSYQYLWTDQSSQYLLKMPFIDHIFDNQVVDDITVKIILPESSKMVDIAIPFAYERGNDGLEYTYLDTVGRPVIVLSKKNAVDEHIKEFQLRYTFNKMMLLREPLLVVGFFYLLFLFVIVYVRLDFSIAHDDAAESKLKVASYAEQAQNILDRRSALYQSYEDATKKYKASKDLNSYQANKKKVETDHKQLTKQLTDLQTKLKQEGADVAHDKIGDIQKLDTQLKDSATHSSTLAEKLVGNKLAKDAYVSQEETASKKRVEILNEIEKLAAAL